MDDFHQGLLKALALFGPALMASGRLTRPLTGATRACGMAVATLALLTSASLLLGVAGWLSVGPLIGLAGLFSALLARVGSGGGLRQPWPATVVWPLLLTLPPLAVNGVRALLSPPTSWDSLAYHLPFVLHWYGSGSLATIPALTHYPGQVSYFPGGGELCWLWAAFAFRSDFAFGVLNHGFLALGAVAVYGLARSLLARSTTALAAAAVYLTLPLHFMSLLGTANVDLYLTFALLAGLLLALDPVARETRPELALAAGGLLAGIKLSGLWLLPVMLWIGWRAGLRPRLLPALLILGCLGGFWYGRNLALTGNPVYPLPVRFLGVAILSAGPTGQMDTFAGHIQRPGILRELAEALWGNLGPAGLAIPVALLVQLLGIGQCRLHRDWAVFTMILGLLWGWLPGTGILIDYNLRYLLPAVAMGLVAVAVVEDRFIATESAAAALGGLCVSQQLLMVSPYTQAPLPWMALAGAAVLLGAGLVRFQHHIYLAMICAALLDGLTFFAHQLHFRPGSRVEYFLKNYHGGLMIPLARWVEELPPGRRIAAAGSLPPYYLWGQRFQHQVLQFSAQKPIEWASAVTRGNPEYLVMGRIRTADSYPPEETWAQADPNQFEPVWSNAHIRVYRVKTYRAGPSS